jgi:hypothetical protein
MTQVQFTPDDEELPEKDLVADLDSEPPDSISAEEALQDVEYLFSLLSHGYSGYHYFETIGDFDAAKKGILHELETQPTWSPRDFSELIHEHIRFIRDGHLHIGYHRYFAHKDFWYSNGFELWKTQGHYYFLSGNIEYKVATINGALPDGFVFPSLTSGGLPTYILGMLSDFPPDPLVLTAAGTAQRQFQVELHQSVFAPGDIFSEDTCDGIPVITIRSFLDTHTDELNQFLATASTYRGEPYIIIDVRSNGGGNSNWPQQWITQFTGTCPEEIEIITELKSKTTLMGRINLYQYLMKTYPDMDESTLQREMDVCYQEIHDLEGSAPYWTTFTFPSIEVIPATTTIIVLTDRGVASSGEMFLSYLRQVEHVVFVGENTAGAGIFGEVTAHQLPNSALPVLLGCKLFIPVDLEFTEEKGLFPDVWVPAEYALDYTVAALKNRTLAPQETSLEELTPEKPDAGCTTGYLVTFILICCLLYKS